MGGFKRIFGPKSEELTRDWRKLHDGELHDLCCSRNITSLVRSRRMRGGDEALWVRGGEAERHTVVCCVVAELKVRGNIEGTGLGTRILLKRA